MRALWSRLESWLRANAPASMWDGKLRAGASESDIVAAEAALGLPFPADFRESLGVHDGDERFWEHGWLPDGMGLLPLSEMITQWQTEQGYYRDFVTEEYAEAWQDHDRIANVVLHPRRIPIAMQEGESELWLDGVPGPAGRIGQVTFNLTECDFIVVGDDFHDFLHRYVGLLETGLFVYDQEPRQIVSPRLMELSRSNDRAYWDYYRSLFQ